MSNLDALKSEVVSLTESGDLDGAIKKCQDFLEFDENSEALALLNALEAKKRAETNDVVSAALKKANTLWDEKNYDKLYALLIKLNKMAPQDKRIEKQIVKLQNIVGSEADSKRQELRGSAETKVRDLYEKGDYRMVLKATTELLDVDPTNAFAAEFETKAKSQIVSKEIDNIKAAHYPKNQYKEAIEAMMKLVEDYGRDQLILKSVQDADQKMVQSIRSRQENTINKGLVEVNKHIKNKNLSDALLVVRELESVNAKHKKVIAVKAKLEKAFESETNKEIIDLLNQRIPLLENDYKQSPGDYIAI